MEAAPPQPIRFTIEDPAARGFRADLQIASEIIARIYTLPLVVIWLASRARADHTTSHLWWLVLAAYVAIMFVTIRRSLDFEHSLERKNVPTVVTFAETGIEIAREGRRGRETTRFVPFRKIRRVSSTKGDVIITVGETPFVLPAAALPEAGEAIMNYFEDRIVGKWLLQKKNTSYRRTTAS